MHRLLMFLAIREGRTDEVLEQLAREAARIGRDSDEVEARVFRAEEDDPLAALIQHMRPYEAVLELRVATRDAASLLLPMVEGLGARLGEGIHADLSGAVFVEENRVVPAPEDDLRYFALMRRMAGTSHDAYVDYYAKVHVEIGRRCPGKNGYHQNYVDGDVSRRAANACGFGMWDLDSVTELFFRSAAEFDRATSESSIREESAADEAHFVDGPTMAGFCARIVSRSPA